MHESQRRKETMRFFNMINEPERTLAIGNYEDNFDSDVPNSLLSAIYGGFRFSSLENSPTYGMYWKVICDSIENNTYNFKTEPMEHKEETSLDYMIGVMKAKEEECKPVQKFVRNENSFYSGMPIEMCCDERFDWVHNHYEVKPEPPKPKTVPFISEDYSFLLGLTIRIKLAGLYKYYTILSCDYAGIQVVDKIFFFYDTIGVEYQDPETKHWKPFLKEVKE